MTIANDTIDILDELSDNFLVSSLDTNMGRAFPDVRDGLKPGQRTILWEMWTKKYLSNKPHVKSAKISGGVIANWWPHSDVAIYETFARMSQNFTNNVPEIDFHGANGNIILGGDAVANQRYTEARLSPIVEEGMFQGIDKNTVDMVLNFSEDAKMPKVLPAVFPRLLVNGAQGIGVSISNVWLGHNFKETGELILKYIKDGILDEDNYYPDFPTGGTIVNKNDLAAINKTGKGKVIVEAAYEINGNEINFYEMPYQVYIEPVIEQIKQGIESNKIHGVVDVFNKSDKKRISLVVSCGRGVDVEKTLVEIFSSTDLRKQYNANQNGIIGKTPTLLNLKQVVDVYIEHNCSCIKREHEYDYEKAKSRIHILEGLLKAISNIDNVIEIIRNDKTPAATLKITFNLDDEQVKAILDMRLARLSKLEVDKVKDELQEKKDLLSKCEKVINSLDEQKHILVERLSNLVKKYGAFRRTKVEQKKIIKLTAKKLITQIIPQDVIVTYNKLGYLQRIPVKAYRAVKNDNIVNSFKTQTTDMIVLFSSLGKVFRIGVDNIVECGMKDKGTAVGSLLNLEPNEKILNIFSMNIDEKHPYIVGFTKNGLVKKSDKTIYLGETQNKKGMKAAGLVDGDEYIAWYECNGDYAVMASNDGYIIQFELDKVNPVGKTARGVKGISLEDSDYVIEALVCRPGIDTIEFKKYNKTIKGIKVQGRGGKGRKIA